MRYIFIKRKVLKYNILKTFNIITLYNLNIIN